MKLVWTQFLGELPQIDPMLLTARHSTRAWNIKFQRGDLQSLKKPSFYREARNPMDQLSLYRFAPVPGDPESGWIFGWDTVVDCVPGPVVGNSQHLTYWSGEGVPKYTDHSIATSDVGPLPANSYDLGVPPPEYGPQVEIYFDYPTTGEIAWTWRKRLIWAYNNQAEFLSRVPPNAKIALILIFKRLREDPRFPELVDRTIEAAKDALVRPMPADDEEEEPPPEEGEGEEGEEGEEEDHLPDYEEYTVVDRDYVVTFVHQLGSLQMEGPPSDPSPIIGVPAGPGWGVRVSNLPMPPAGDYPMAFKRIYRRLYSGGVVQFGMVAEVVALEEEYIDIIPDAEVPGDLLVSTFWDPPPEDMHSLGVLSNGIMFGARDNDICISEPYLPHAWSPFSRYPVPHSIVGMGQADGNIVAVTLRNPYLVTGVQPGAMSTIELKMDQGCLGKRSIVSGSFGCCFASPDGLILISGGGSQVLTEGMFTRNQWQTFNPASMVSTVNEDLLIITFTRLDESRGTMIINPRNLQAGVRFTSQVFTGAHHDGLLDSLLVYDPEQRAICLWDEGEKLPYTWRSNLNILPVPGCMTAARVEADSYEDLTFSLFIDQELKYTCPVKDDRLFRLPAGYRHRTVQAEISGTDLVRKVCLAESPYEIE